MDTTISRYTQVWDVLNSSDEIMFIDPFLHEGEAYIRVSLYDSDNLDQLIEEFEEVSGSYESIPSDDYLIFRLI